MITCRQGTIYVLPINGKTIITGTIHLLLRHMEAIQTYTNDPIDLLSDQWHHRCSSHLPMRCIM